MRLLFRIFGLSIVGLIFTVMFIELISYNIRFDELSRISSLAMTNTQILAEEAIEDEYYLTNNARVQFMSDDEYVNCYIDNLKSLITSKSKYSVEVMGVDHKRGLLDLMIYAKYKRLDGSIKVIKTRKTSVIDVLLEA